MFSALVCVVRFPMKDISVFSYVIAGFPFFQNTSDYLNSRFSWLPFGETTANLQGFTVARPSTRSSSNRFTRSNIDKATL